VLGHFSGQVINDLLVGNRARSVVGGLELIFGKIKNTRIIRMPLEEGQLMEVPVHIVQILRSETKADAMNVNDRIFVFERTIHEIVRFLRRYEDTIKSLEDRGTANTRKNINREDLPEHVKQGLLSYYQGIHPFFSNSEQLSKLRELILRDRLVHEATHQLTEHLFGIPIDMLASLDREDIALMDTEDSEQADDVDTHVTMVFDRLFKENSSLRRRFDETEAATTEEKLHMRHMAVEVVTHLTTFIQTGIAFYDIHNNFFYIIEGSETESGHHYEARHFILSCIGSPTIL